MIKFKQTLLSIAAIASLAASGATEDKAVPEKTMPKELKNQTVCPVMGGKIDSTVYTDIQGQRVYHCCPKCSPKLKADPDKYFKEAAAEGILFENIQKLCPVSDEPIDKDYYVDYEGRRVYLCCAKCEKKFNDDPAKFLKKLDEPAKETKPAESQSHDDHDHH